MRGYLEAFTDLAAAEADYRRGLELRPSDAKGYAGLAAVLWEQPAKRRESLEMLEHARRLDPLEPAHDVAKAVFLSYDRGDSKGAEALLRNVLQRKPDYLPAIVRLAEFSQIPAGNFSEAIRYYEQALRLDPMSQWSRRLLAKSYLDVGDEHAAEALIKSSPVRTSILELPLPIYRKQWQRAGELAYLALDDRLVSPADEPVMTIAVRRHARATGDYVRALEALQTFTGITWTDDGVPRVPHRQGLMSAAVGVADLLLAAGETERGQRLLRAIIEQITADLRSGAKSETWLSDDLAIAQLLAGDRQRALDTLEHAFAAGIFRHSAWHFEDADPAFDAVRTDARFVALSRRLRLHMEQERVEVEKMRAAGELPRR
jgi:tetratricopeptide (TPR) repeat protein